MARLTDDQKQNIIFLYSSHSCREISILMGMSIQSVYNVIKEKGIKKRKHTKVDYEGIRQDYSNGFTDIDFLKKKYSCCEMTIYKAIADLERIKRHHRPNSKEIDIIHDLKQMSVTGCSTAQIARRHNVSRQYIYQVKERLKEINYEI